MGWGHTSEGRASGTAQDTRLACGPYCLMAAEHRQGLPNGFPVSQSPRCRDPIGDTGSCTSHLTRQHPCGSVSCIPGASGEDSTSLIIWGIERVRVSRSYLRPSSPRWQASVAPRVSPSPSSLKDECRGPLSPFGVSSGAPRKAAAQESKPRAGKGCSPTGPGRSPCLSRLLGALGTRDLGPHCFSPSSVSSWPFIFDEHRSPG